MINRFEDGVKEHFFKEHVVIACPVPDKTKITSLGTLIFLNTIGSNVTVTRTTEGRQSGGVYGNFNLIDNNLLDFPILNDYDRFLISQHNIDLKKIEFSFLDKIGSIPSNLYNLELNQIGIIAGKSGYNLTIISHSGDVYLYGNDYEEQRSEHLDITAPNIYLRHSGKFAKLNSTKIKNGKIYGLNIGGYSQLSATGIIDIGNLGRNSEVTDPSILITENIKRECKIRNIGLLNAHHIDTACDIRTVKKTGQEASDSVNAQHIGLCKIDTGRVKCPSIDKHALISERNRIHEPELAL